MKNRKVKTKQNRIFIIIALLAILVTTFYILIGHKATQDVIESPVTEGSGLKTIVTKDSYSFTIDVPEGYTFTKLPDYADAFAYVTNGKQTIRFEQGAGGEYKPLGKTSIDGVTFRIAYRKDIGCSANLYPDTIPTTGRGIYLFDIIIDCKDNDNAQTPIFSEMLRTMKFSKDFKDVLLGIKEMPQD